MKNLDWRGVRAWTSRYVSQASGPIPSLTKGSVISADVGGVPLTLASGTHGYALVADSGAASGLGWAAFAGSNFYLDGLSFGTDSKITGSMTGVGDVVSNAMTTFTPATTFTAEASFTTGLVVGGNATAAGYIKINPDTDDTGDYPTTIKVGVNTEAQTYTLPLAYPDASGYALTSTDAGVMSWAANDDANYYATGGSLASGDITIEGTTGFPSFDIDVSSVATGSIGSSTQYYNTFYNAATGLVGSAYLQTDSSNNIILSGASNIAKTAVDFQSTLGVSGALSVSGAASFLEPVTIDNATGVGISATGTNNFKGALTQEGTSLLSGNTTITGSVSTTTSATIGTSADIGTTLTATGAATFKSTADITSTLVATGATTLKSTLNVGSTTNITGVTNWVNLARNQIIATPDVGTASFKISDEVKSGDSSSYVYYPRIHLAQDETDGAAGEHAGYPTIFFTKYGPTSIANPAGDPVGWRIAASGASGVVTAPQTMVWEYSTDQSSYSEKLSLNQQGHLTAASFMGSLSGTIDSATTATTQSASDNSTKVATTAYVDAAAGGGGTIGGSIADNQIAIGASTANSIEGADTFAWDASTLTMTNTGDTAITLLGDANRSGENSHAMAMRGKWDGTVIGTMMIMTGPDTTNKDDGQLAFYTASAGTQAERMRIDETGNVGIGTSAPNDALDVRGNIQFSGSIYVSGSDLGGRISRVDTNEVALYAGTTEEMRLGVTNSYLKGTNWHFAGSGYMRISGTNTQLQFEDDEHYIYSDGTDLHIKTTTTASQDIALTSTGKLVVDAGDDINLDAHSSVFNFKRQGAEMFRLTCGASSPIAFQPKQDAYDIAFNQYDGTEVMRITDGADVGIGTTAPGETLHVVGTGRFTGKAAFGGSTLPTNNGISVVDTIQLSEKGSSPTATTAWGTVWVSGSTPNKLYFTDDAGTAHDLTAGGGIGGSVSSGYIPYASSADTLANALLFTSGATESMYLGATPGTLNAANYNTTLGYQAGDDMTEGDENTLIGQQAGMNVTTGDANTMIGRGAGTFMTTQINNTFVGSQAGYSAAGQYNTFLGALAGYNTSSDLGNMNIFVGYGAAQNMQGAAERNIAIGTYAMYSDTDATSSTAHNIAIGHESMKEISTGYNNIAIGRETLLDTKSGYNNVAVGYQAGYNVSTGHTNTLVGGQAARTLTTALGNTAIGYDSLYKATIGGENVAVGKMAGYNYAGTSATTEGAFSTFLGYAAGYAVTGGTNWGHVIAIGHQPMYNATGANKSMAIGNSALVSGTDALDVIAIGQGAGSYADATGSVYLGNKAGFRTSGNYNTAIGYRAMSGSSSGDTSHNNVAIGYDALENTESANENVIIGNFAGTQMTEGDYNTAVGYAALRSGTTTNRQVAVGYAALSNFTQSGDLRNVAVGMYAMLYPRSGSNNIAMGYGAMQGDNSVYDSDYNVALGSDTLFDIAGGDNNTAVGYQAGTNVSTGQGNTLIGYKAGSAFDTENYAVAVGSEALKDAVGDVYAIAIGYRALANSDATGGQNIAMGQSAGRYFSSSTSDSVVIGGSAGAGSSTTDFGGSSVVAVGGNALQDLVSGSYTIGIGRNAFSNTLSGQASIAIGGNAGQNAFNLQDCIFIGTSAGKGAGGGASAGIKSNYDIAIGYQAGMRFGSGATATYSNVAIGPDAMGQTVTGNYNVAIGHGAASGATDVGDQNVAIGYLAGKVSTGNYNVFVGASAGLAATSTTLSTIVGKEAGQGVMTGEGNSLFGYRAGYSLTSAHDNTIIGKSAGQNATTSMRDSVIVGFKALLGYTTNSSHGRFTVVGGEAGYNVASTSSNKNNYTAIGFQAGYNDKSDSSHQLFGSSAGYNLSGTSSDGSTFVGGSAGRGKSTGYIAIDTVGMGRSVLSDEAKYTFGDIFIGSRAASNFVSGSYNISIGYDSMRYGGQATIGAHNNVAIGQAAGYNLGRHAASTGSVALGKGAGYYVSGGSKNIYIGFDAGPSSATASESNQLYIHNTSGTPLIGGDFSAKEVNISGSVELINGAITSNPGTNHLWASGATLFWGGSQLGTTTPGAGAIEGTATAGEVSYGDGSNSITSSSNFTFDGNHLKLLDDKKLILGTGDDMQIYHNGSNSYVTSQVGDLNILNTANDADIKFKIKDNTVETEVIRIVGATSRVGIGTTSPDFKLDVRDSSYNVALVSGAGNGNYPILHVKDSADQWPAWFEGNRSGDPGAGIRLWHNPASSAENNNTYVHFCMNNDADERVTYANIKGTIDDYTDGTEDGKVKIFVMADGSETESVNFSKNGIIIDEYTRIMRNTSTNGLYLTDSGGNPVKLSTASGTNGGISFDNTTANTMYRGAGVSYWDSTESYRLQGNTTSGYLQLDMNKISLVRDASSAASNVLQIGDGGTYDQFSIVEDQRGSTATNGLLYLRAKKTGNFGYATLALRAASGSNISEMYVNGISTNEAFRFDTNSKSHAFDIAKAGYVSVGGAVDSTNQFTVVGTTHLSGAATVTGVLSATAKSFNIEHPLYKDKRLVHGSLEGPEHGIYIRGTIESKEYGCEIELPEYWSAMCDDYTVQLTPHGPYTVYISGKEKDKVMVASTSREYKFDYYVVGSRTDETLEVVQDG